MAGTRPGGGAVGVTPPRAGAGSTSPQRLLSLDVFRGLLVTYMVVAWGVGDRRVRYSQMVHATWEGWTLHDLFFPWFLFAIGSAMAFALVPRVLDAGLASVMPRMTRRVVVLFGLGLVVNLIIERFPPPSQLRLMGPLQLIGLAYLAGALLALVLPRRLLLGAPPVLLLSYWALQTLVPVPGHGPGVLTPEGNIGGLVDRAVIGMPRLYEGGPYDPEGILAVLPATAIVLMGLAAGRWIREKPGVRTAAMMCLAGGVMVAAGYAWSVGYPFIKWIWTGSFVLVAVGIGLAGQGLLHGVIDVAGYRRRAWILEVLGRNALFSYVSWLAIPAALAVPRVNTGEGPVPLYRWLYEILVAPWASPLIGARNASLLFGAFALVLWWLLLHRLYRRGIFIRP